MIPKILSLLGWASIGVAATYLNNNYDWPKFLFPISWFLDLVLLPAYVAAGFAGGNIHQPSEVITYAFLFLEYIAIGVLVSYLMVVFRK